MPVQAGDRLAGLLTVENIGEFVLIQSALANRPRRNPSVLPAMTVPPILSPLTQEAPPADEPRMQREALRKMTMV